MHGMAEVSMQAFWREWRPDLTEWVGMQLQVCHQIFNLSALQDAVDVAILMKNEI